MFLSDQKDGSSLGSIWEYMYFSTVQFISLCSLWIAPLYYYRECCGYVKNIVLVLHA